VLGFRCYDNTQFRCYDSAHICKLIALHTANAYSAKREMSASACTRACLDQLLIAIRSLTLLCDHSRSKTRLIAITNLIAKLRIIYTMACHASLCSTALDCLSVSCHCYRTALTTIYKHGMGCGRWGLASQLQQQLVLWVCVKCCVGCH